MNVVEGQIHVEPLVIAGWNHCSIDIQLITVDSRNSLIYLGEITRMSFELFLKALRQLLEPVSVKKHDAGKGELEGVTMKKALKKTAPKAAAKKATKPTAKAAVKKSAPKKVDLKKVAPAKVAKAEKPVVKTAAKPTVLKAAPKVEAPKPVKVKASTAKQNKAAELAQKAELEKANKMAQPKTLKEALAGNIKRAVDMEPETVLQAVEQQDATDQEKKALARKLAQAGTNYDTVYKIAKAMKIKNYKMSETFEPRTPIMHKILGWGFILSCENNRIQVLVKEGVKTLITNYQK